MIFGMGDHFNRKLEEECKDAQMADISQNY